MAEAAKDGYSSAEMGPRNIFERARRAKLQFKVAFFLLVRTEDAHFSGRVLAGHIFRATSCQKKLQEEGHIGQTNPEIN